MEASPIAYPHTHPKLIKLCIQPKRETQSLAPEGRGVGCSSAGTWHTPGGLKHRARAPGRAVSFPGAGALLCPRIICSAPRTSTVLFLLLPFWLHLY